MLIVADHLSKRYEENWACNEICLSVEEGQVFGLLGPNGAGKSTLVKMLLGLVMPTSGQAYIHGLPPTQPRARQRLGYLPELFRFYDWLSARELLLAFLRMHNMDIHEEGTAVDRALTLSGLKGREHELIRNYSKGMQQRLGLAAALVHKPDLIFLDEPTSALDPGGRRDVRELIGNLQSEGCTLFINSHLLTEMEFTCTHLAFIRKGNVIASGRTRDFTLAGDVVNIEVDQMPAGLIQSWEAQGRMVTAQGSTLQVAINDEVEIPKLVAALVEQGTSIYRVERQARSLEDVFIKLIQS